MTRYRVTVSQNAVYFVDAYSPAYAVRKALSLASVEEQPAYRLESSADAEIMPELELGKVEATCRTTER